MAEAVIPSFDFTAYLAKARSRVEAALDVALGPERPNQLREAMRYSLLAGGKRLRPILCLASCELTGEDSEKAIPTAVAIEIMAKNFSAGDFCCFVCCIVLNCIS